MPKCGHWLSKYSQQKFLLFLDPRSEGPMKYRGYIRYPFACLSRVFMEFRFYLTQKVTQTECFKKDLVLGDKDH